MKAKVLILTIFTLFSLTLMASEEVVLVEERERRQDGEPYWDENGRIYVTAYKKVWSRNLGSDGSSSSSNSYWHIQSVASSEVSMRALNENEDWNAYAEIKGTADRNQRQPPPHPTTQKLVVLLTV